MSVNLLYMNQGGGGNWGAIKYSDYDILCLAESTVVKEGFNENYNSKTQPPMSVQTATQYELRVISELSDLDTTAREVRPILFFQVTVYNPFYVVFSHLKSASEPYATKALETAVTSYLAKGYDPALPVLWIGDFNRAETGSLSKLTNYELLLKGGGIALWDLDRAIITGKWKGPAPVATEASRSGDNQHIGIKVSFS